MERSVNAPLCILLPTPDGSGQAVHPDVIFVPEGFQGYTYWMACTPYPFGVDRYENPVIRVSNDGHIWRTVPGAPDPLVGAPADRNWHHADTDLVLHAGTLYVFYISTLCEGARTTFSVTTSTDGVCWTTPLEIYRAPWGVSPAVCVDSLGQWSMWYVYLDTVNPSADAQLFRRVGQSAVEFGDAEPCQLKIPGYKLWHLDVIRTQSGFEALVVAFPRRADPSVSSLFWATSSDGISWTLQFPQPILRRSLLGWDNRMVYRSSFLRREDGNYRVWYSAASWGMRCGIGYLEGPINALRPARGALGALPPPVAVRAREDLVGWGKYVIARFFPRKVYAALVAARRALRGDGVHLR